MPTLVVGMTRRDSFAYMLAVSLRSLSKHGTHESHENESPHYGEGVRVCMPHVTSSGAINDAYTP